MDLHSHILYVFKHLVGGWTFRQKGVTGGKNGVALRSSGAKGMTLAGLIFGASAGPLVKVGWNSLNQHGVSKEDLEEFKKAVPRPALFKITESSAHLPIDDSFTNEM